MEEKRKIDLEKKIEKTKEEDKMFLEEFFKLEEDKEWLLASISME